MPLEANYRMKHSITFLNQTQPIVWKRILSVLIALSLWQIVSMVLGLGFLLPSPLTVLVSLGKLSLQPAFYQTILFSFLRIVAGFLSALILGFVLALLAGRFPIAETFLWPYVITIKSVPVASFIIISLIWLTTGQLTVFISFLMVFPLIYTNVLQGIKSADPQLVEMAHLFRVPYFRRLGYIYLPQIRPYLVSACSMALGLSWKSGVAAEVIGVVNGSIGEQLYESKIYFETGNLFAWTLVIVLISVVFEKGFLWLIKHAFDAWENRE